MSFLFKNQKLSLIILLILSIWIFLFIFYYISSLKNTKINENNNNNNNNNNNEINNRVSSVIINNNNNNPIKIKQNKNDIIRNGYNIMKQSNVIICGITRDNASNMVQTLDLIDRINGCFQQGYIILYENDSCDKTVEIIQHWKQTRKSYKDLKKTKDNVVLISEKLNWPSAISSGGLSKGRFEKLAYCRNKCLGEIRKTKYDSVTYVINLDMDLFDCPLDGIAHSFGCSDQWDSVSANGVYGKKTYFDGLAFRNQEFTDTLNFDSQRYGSQLIYSPDLPLVPVDSAFGGLAIYKRKCLLDCNYNGDDCEHVALHQCQKNTQGCQRIFMNPAMYMYYPF